VGKSLRLFDRLRRAAIDLAETGARQKFADILCGLFFPHRVDEAALVQFLNEAGIHQVRRITAR